ncbi:MAG: iron-siderophore ABC transporter substrate-binding protein [Cyanobacteria bacterium P01_C01_bin.118]
MFDSYCRNIVGWLVVGTLLASCQSGSSSPPPAVELTRTVAHAMGTTKVPTVPQRVVTLDTAPLDAALALGVKPVGMAIYKQPPEYLKDKIDGIKVIGDGNQPNLETTLALKPDLLLGSTIGQDQTYDQLSQIAPTVLTEGSGRTHDWQKNLQLYAEALGKSETAEQLLQAYQQKVQQLQEKIDQPQTLEISVLIVNETIRAYTTGSFSGSILQDIGFSRPPAQADPDGYSLELSAEALDTLDGDYIFLIYSTYRPGGSQKEDFVTDPLWSQLKAVQQDRVCQVSGDVWIAGRNILAANQILADVEQCLESREASKRDDG